MSKKNKKKAKDSLPTTEKKKNKAKEEIQTAKKEAAATIEKPKEAKGLPKKVQDKMIVCQEKMKAKPLKVSLSDITATSKQIYVDNIHHANPQILHTNYWVIMPNTRHVVAHVTEEQYHEILKLAPKISHLISVVDCAVMPTLTYGSWTIQEVPDFPTLEQIAEQDAKFKKNPTRVHNELIAIELYEEEPINIEEEDEEFDFDFGEDEEEFDFEDD